MDAKSTAAVDRQRTSSQLLDLWSHLRTSLFWMTSIALVLRVGWIIVGHTYRFKSVIGRPLVAGRHCVK